MAEKKLTLKQEKFCQAFIETGNQSEAYRRSYNASKMKPDVVNVKASELMATGIVSVRVAELREQHAKRHRVTVDDLLGELEEARQAALRAETVQAGAAISASMGKAKLLGMDRQILEHTGKDGGPIETVALSRTEYLKARKAMLADDDC